MPMPSLRAYTFANVISGQPATGADFGSSTNLGNVHFRATQ